MKYLAQIQNIWQGMHSILTGSATITSPLIHPPLIIHQIFFPIPPKPYHDVPFCEPQQPRHQQKQQSCSAVTPAHLHYSALQPVIGKNCDIQQLQPIAFYAKLEKPNDTQL